MRRNAKDENDLMNYDGTEQGTEQGTGQIVSARAARRSTECCVLIPAAGMGTRFGGLKQFEPMNNKQPVILYTVRRVIREWEALAEEADFPFRLKKIIVASPKDEIDRMKNILADCGRDGLVEVAEGGATRFESVRNAYSYLKSCFMREKGVADALRHTAVAVHDGCRPFVSKKLWKALLETLESTDFVLPYLNVTDTLKEREGYANMAREDYITVQTPQVMHMEVADRIYAYSATRNAAGSCDEKQNISEGDSSELCDATRNAAGGDVSESCAGGGHCSDFVQITDDATLARRFGFEIKCVLGEKSNLKITDPEDMIFVNSFSSFLRSALSSSGDSSSFGGRRPLRSAFRTDSENHRRSARSEGKASSGMRERLKKRTSPKKRMFRNDTV